MKEGFNTVLVVGVGLIGGSLALALKEKKITKTVIGYSRNIERLKKAVTKGIIDDFTDALDKTSQADLVVLATPVSVFEALISQMRDYIKKDTIIIDVGSVKGSIVEKIERLLPSEVYFVGTHPIAGSEKTGFEYARADLFINSKVIITPTDKTAMSALEKVTQMWKHIGADVEFMSPEQHDRVYALVSHLPHLLSYCLVETVAQFDKFFINYAGSGFRDITRVAKSSPELWSDIFITNRENILNFLEMFTNKLKQMRDLILKENITQLKAFLESARKLRESID
ncbi:MAG: prephenate dehydrogenase/arogenate dehydrogenase family protein [Thermodesulfovibrionaceae bacterium]